MRTSALIALLLAGAAFAGPPSAEELARIQHDVKKAQDAVDKKYEGRDLSADEKKQQIKERAAAENGVLDKAGVDRKDYARAGAKMSKEDRETVRSESEKLKEKDKAASGSQGGSKEVVIEKGGQDATDADEAAKMDRAAGYGKKKK